VPQRDSGTMTIDDDKPEARRGFFGRRKGHRLRSHQATLLDTLLPRLALDVSAPPPAKLSHLFPVPVDEVRFEIGFGGGEYLIAQARAHSRTGFIGCEPFINGMAKALAAIQTHGLANIRLHLGDAVPLIDRFPAASLAGVDLIYPDPWPKRRHWKRRFVQERTVADMARIVRRGGDFRFVSDIPDYAAWTLARLLRCPDFIWTAERADDWRQPWPGFVRTRYEAKAIREGRMPCYLVFRRE
jgi:tRNA (guanine-N7-)-methyltransferase